MSELRAAIRMLSASKWYQDGNMDAESLMNELERLNRRSTPASSPMAEDARDAERYRFLQRNAAWDTPWISIGDSDRCKWLAGTRADQAIDLAIARQRGEGAK